MNRFLVCVLFAVMLTPLGFAQSSSAASSPAGKTQAALAITQSAKGKKKAKNQEVFYRPFSQVGIGGGFSLMGINLEAATNVNRYLNVRGSGSVFNYTENNISTDGFNIDGKLKMASAGLSVDYYPFPTHGLRLSPGLLLYNQNTVSANVMVEGGTSFKLNHDEYFSSISNPVQGTAAVGFNARNPAFTLTTGWGNLISRKGSRISLPFEIGAAFVGAPTVNAVLTQGQVCEFDNSNCRNVATDATLQADLQAELAKYRKDLEPLKVYPIVSFGFSYRFGIRPIH